MNNWIIVTIDFGGRKVALEEEYTTWEAACEAQEMLEEQDDSLSYLIYTQDIWMYECENGEMC